MKQDNFNSVINSYNKNARKKWNIDDINNIIAMKNNGIKLKFIGDKYNVTANAIRKALLRHSAEYIKPITKPIDLDMVSYKVTESFAINWGLRNNIIKKVNNYIYHNESRMIDTISVVFLINKYRLMNNLPSFRIRYE